MAAHRKLQPDDAAKTIETLAAQGFAIVGIAKHLGVSRETFKKWCEEDGELQEAFEIGRETERQALHALIVQSAVLNKPANVNAFFILKARHGYRDNDSPNTKVDVNVALANPVMIVRDHGDDAAWAAKVAAQQRALTIDADCTSPLQIEASTATPVDAAPYYGPPIFDWQSQPAPTPIFAPEPLLSVPAVHPVAPCEAPVWRRRT